MNVSYKEAAGLFGLFGLYSTELTGLTSLFGLHCGEGERSAREGGHSADVGRSELGEPNANRGFGFNSTGVRGFFSRPGLPRGSTSCTFCCGTGSSGGTSLIRGTTCVMTD